MADTASSPAPQKSRLNRWLAIALVASVAINLAFVGWGATRWWKFHRMAERPAGQFEEQVAKRLPDNAAKAFRKAVEATRKGDPVSFHQLRRDIAEALATEPFDRARFEAVLEEHRQRLDQFQRGMQMGLLAAAETMSPEQRQEYAQRMLRHGPRPPPPPR